MNFSIPVGNGHVLEYIGNWFTGAEQLKVDGKIIFQRIREDELTRFEDAGTSRRDEFDIGHDDPINGPIKGVFETEKPYFYANMRPYTYRVFADGKLLHEQTGF